MTVPRIVLALVLAVGCADDSGDDSDGGTGRTDTGDGQPTSGATDEPDPTAGEPESGVWDTPYCRPVKDGPAWPQVFRDWEEEVLVLVNEARAKGHDCDAEGQFGPTTPLTMNPSLRCAARKHAADMATRDYFDHVSPEGETFIERIARAGYGSYAQIGENIAAGLDNPAETVAGWLDSDGHCANIMSPSYAEFGAGAYEGPGAYVFYWTQEFGRRN